MATDPNHQDSNNTGLRYAVEDSPGVLPMSPIWLPLEPNDYSDFGGDYKAVARRPINASRQRKKGTIVDLDAKGGFTQDLTGTNAQDLLQTVLFAALRTKDEKTVATVDGSANSYVLSSGGAVYERQDLILAKGADDAANNGLKEVTGVPSGTVVLVTDTNLVDAATQAITISRVGYEFDTGKASINVAGTWPKLLTATVAATATLTNDGTNVTAGDTVTITGPTEGVVVYTFQDPVTVGSAGAVHVLRGASNTASMTNLFRAINSSGGTPGTDYDTTGTGSNADVVATNPSGTTVLVTAAVAGKVGNEIVIAENGTHTSWSGAGFLVGGLGRGGNTFGFIPGETIFVGGDDPTEQFFTGSNGFARIRSTAASYIEFDKTEDDFAADDGTANNSGGTGQTIRIFFGRVLKNENGEDADNPIVARTLQVERTLGPADLDAPTVLQAEYLTASLINEFVFDMKTADKVTTKVTFLSGGHELQSSVKSGTRPDIEESDCFNTTSDVSYLKMALVVDGEPAQDALFAYLTDLSFTIKNNIKQNKAVSVLGAFSTTAGIFEVSADVTAYFTKIAGIQAVRNNDDVTIAGALVKDNRGMNIDIPLVGLGKAMADVKIDEAIMLPISADAGEGTPVAAAYDHTMMICFYDYLPDLAD